MNGTDDNAKTMMIDNNNNNSDSNNENDIDYTNNNSIDNNIIYCNILYSILYATCRFRIKINLP